MGHPDTDALQVWLGMKKPGVVQRAKLAVKVFSAMWALCIAKFMSQQYCIKDRSVRPSLVAP